VKTVLGFLALKPHAKIDSNASTQEMSFFLSISEDAAM
jgi:hypothetical protein